MAIIESLQHQDLHAIRVGRFNKGINSSFIVYQLGTGMIDTGPANQWRYVQSFVEQQQVQRVILTHFHEDHSGNSADLCNMGIAVYAPPLTQKLLKKPYKMPLIQKLIWGTPKAANVALLPDSVELSFGEVLTPISVPGHCEEMNAYLLAERGWLFSGDLYIASKVRYLHRHENFAEHIQSIKKVLNYDFDTMFCPHRGIVENGKQALENKLDYMENLISEAKKLQQQGLPLELITKKILGREDAMYLLSGGEFAKRHLIAACLEV